LDFIETSLRDIIDHYVILAH